MSGTVTDFFGVPCQPIVLFPGIQCSRQRHLLRRMPVADGHVAVARREEPARAGFPEMFPKLITIGKFFIPTYGTLVALGFLLALWVTVRLARRAKLPAEPVTNLAIYCALAGLAGAKLFMILFDLRSYWMAHGRCFR